MSYKEQLMGLQGKQMAICEPDSEKFRLLNEFLKHYGIETVALNSVEAMQEDLESRRYATIRVYVAVFVAAELIESVEPLWLEVTKMNPGIRHTPLILMGSEKAKSAIQPLINKGYFSFIAPEPISANFVLRTLGRLNRWKVMKGDITPQAILKT